MENSIGRSSEPYLIPTSKCFPISKMLEKDCLLSLGVIVQPFLENEEPLPEVAFNEEEVIRCSHCKSYINPYVEFLGGGQHWRCNYCTGINKVPVWYFAPLDDKGKRSDLSKRPELNNCSYEAIAPEAYIAKAPMACAYLFVIDISQRSRETGFLEVVCETIQSLIANEEFPGIPRTEIGIIGFDTSIHFVSLNGNPTIFTVSEEYAEIELPVPKQQFIVNLEDGGKNASIALTQLQALPVAPQSIAFKNALKAAYLLLKDQGGKVLLFQSDTHLEAGHAREIILSSSPEAYKVIANEFSHASICVDLFISAAQYCNLFALGTVSKFTGGEVYYYCHFTKKQGEEKLQNEIWASVNRETLWEGAMKLRISRDYKATQCYGHFSLRSGDVLAIPALNESQTMSYVIQLENNIASSKKLYIQMGILYTTSNGVRKIRIHNLLLPCSNDIKDLYNAIDASAMVNLISKQTLDQVSQTNKIELGKRILEHRCREIVTTGLNLFGEIPKSLDIFIVSMLGMIKTPIFSFESMQCKLYSDNINLDIFNFLRYKLDVWSASATSIISYPRLYPLHMGYDFTPLNLSYSYLESRGAYLLDTGIEMFIWIGKFLFMEEKHLLVWSNKY